AANQQHGAVDELPAQPGEAFLPLSLTLLLGGADLGAAVSRDRRRGVGGRLNRKRARQERREIVGIADPLPPAGGRAGEQEAIRGPASAWRTAVGAPCPTGEARRQARAIRAASNTVHPRRRDARSTSPKPSGRAWLARRHGTTRGAGSPLRRAA